MPDLPEKARTAWDDREKTVVFSTVDRRGVPNAIYATCANLYEDDKIIIADNYFTKTLENIRNGSSGSVLFITGEKKSYQVKGRVEYLTSGEIYDAMKRWNPPKHPGKAAAVVHVEEVYSGAERLL